MLHRWQAAKRQRERRRQAEKRQQHAEAERARRQRQREARKKADGAALSRPLVADRVRRPPGEGFSWVDRRFLRKFASRLSGDAVFLYLFLAAVSDRQGLSFYRDTTLAVRLRMREQAVVAAREELVSCPPCAC